MSSDFELRTQVDRRGPATTPDREPMSASMRVGAHDDPAERRADQLAADALRRAEPLVPGMSATSGRASRKAETTPPPAASPQAPTPRIQRSPTGGIGAAGGAVDARLESRIERARSSGQPLDPELRNSMEHGFGVPLGQVRIHRSTESDALNHALNSRAFTTRNDIFFRSGEYRPGTDTGNQLIAHELAHVVQSDPGTDARRFPVDSGVDIIRRRMLGTADALEFVSAGGGTRVRRDTWGKLLEAVKRYEELENTQPTGGNFRKITAGFTKLRKQLDLVRSAANRWIAENQEAVEAERNDYRDSSFKAIRDNRDIEQENAEAEARNRSLPEEQRVSLEPLAEVSVSEGILSRKMGAVRSLLLRVGVEEQHVLSGLADPVDNTWFTRAEVFTDRTIDQGEVRDNAVGGALNRLDKGQWSPTPRSRVEGFFIKDKSADPFNQNTGGGHIGIPDFDPNSAGRSIAMARIDALLTDRVASQRAELGLPSAPERMLVDMHLATHTRATAPGSEERETKMGIVTELAEGQELRSGYVTPGRTSGSTEQKQRGGAATRTNLALDDPQLQRGLNKLQLLDAICGQVDRHLANIYVKTNPETGAVERVTGIDNDMAFGAAHSDIHDASLNRKLDQGAWRGLPPIADAELARAILAVTDSDLRAALAGLLADAEIDATVSRIGQVRAFLRGLPANALIEHDDWVARRSQLAHTQMAADSYLGASRRESVNPWHGQNSERVQQSIIDRMQREAGDPPEDFDYPVIAQALVSSVVSLAHDGYVTVDQIERVIDDLTGRAVWRYVMNARDITGQVERRRKIAEVVGDVVTDYSQRHYQGV